MLVRSIYITILYSGYKLWNRPLKYTSGPDGEYCPCPERFNSELDEDTITGYTIANGTPYAAESEYIETIIGESIEKASIKTSEQVDVTRVLVNNEDKNSTQIKENRNLKAGTKDLGNSSTANESNNKMAGHEIEKGKFVMATERVTIHRYERPSIEPYTGTTI